MIYVSIENEDTENEDPLEKTYNKNVLVRGCHIWVIFSITQLVD